MPVQINNNILIQTRICFSSFIIVSDPGPLAIHRTTPEVLGGMRGALVESTRSQSALTSVPGEVGFHRLWMGDECC